MDPVQAAFETIRNRLETGAWSPGERMPVLIELAKLCGVSRGTMWKALSLLKKESLLHTKPRGAILAGAEGFPEKTSPSKGLLWERVKIRLGKEVLAGAFAGQFLPPANKLARRYGITAHTVGKSLEQLVREGLLVADGRKYRHMLSDSRISQPPFVLISAGTRDHGIFVKDPRTQSVVESFERECSRLNHSLRSVGYNVYEAPALTDIESALQETRNPAGYIVNIWNPWNEIHRNRWLDLLHQLNARKVPVIVIDQSGNLPFPRSLAASQHFRVLRIASVRAGAMAADFLFRHGHKRIAYVTPFFNQEWSRSRYEGLCQYFRQYGAVDCGVEYFASGELADANDLRLALLNLDKSELESLYRDRLQRDEIESMKSTLDRLGKMSLPNMFRKDPVTATLRSMTKSLIRQIRSPHDIASCNEVLERIEGLVDQQAMRIYLRPFLSGILKKSTSTAWVCSEDRTALNALLFLKSHRRKVPNEISVLGFDNWKEAYEQNLSTYDFNMDGMVKQALMMIMDTKSLKSAPVISEVDGYVVERRTT
jgi:DNA-binding LacI/PurR family transcriptional regulator/DNA-binding transcriptional regulator YhcF (GntR family)